MAEEDLRYALTHLEEVALRDINKLCGLVVMCREAEKDNDSGASTMLEIWMQTVIDLMAEHERLRGKANPPAFRHTFIHITFDQIMALRARRMGEVDTDDDGDSDGDGAGTGGALDTGDDNVQTEPHEVENDDPTPPAHHHRSLLQLLCTSCLRRK